MFSRDVGCMIMTAEVILYYLNYEHNYIKRRVRQLYINNLRDYSKHDKVQPNGMLYILRTQRE